MGVDEVHQASDVIGEPDDYEERRIDGIQAIRHTDVEGQRRVSTPRPRADPSVEKRSTTEPAPVGDQAGRTRRVARTPLFSARHADRYDRQQLINEYESQTGAALIVVIDTIFPESITYLEELICDASPDQPLHMLLASPGGDGETAIRMVRSTQDRCSELTVVVPDMAKSAATLVCLGADHILMGPAGDLGPVDAQFQLKGRTDLVGAHEIVRAVETAEERVKNAPDTVGLYASLLESIDMLIVEQARSAQARDEALIKLALSCAGSRDARKVNRLAKQIKNELITGANSHSAVFSAREAAKARLPVIAADPLSLEWQLIWELWTRYFAMGCFPAGATTIYEGRRASHIIRQSGK